MSRAENVESVLGSARAEDAEPNAHTIEVLNAWARGELSDADLSEARRRAVHGERFPLPSTASTP